MEKAQEPDVSFSGLVKVLKILPSPVPQEIKPFLQIYLKEEKEKIREIEAKRNARIAFMDMKTERADLKKFASFQLSRPAPPDIVSLLTQNPAKKKELLEKYEAAQKAVLEKFLSDEKNQYYNEDTWRKIPNNASLSEKQISGAVPTKEVEIAWKEPMKTLAKFSRFSSLPKELRIQIWENLLPPPRAVRLFDDSEGDDEVSVNAAASGCSEFERLPFWNPEFKDVFDFHYTMLTYESSQSGQIDLGYFDWRRDTLIVDHEVVGYLASFEAPMFDSFRLVQNIAAQAPSQEGLEDCAQLFPLLKRFTCLFNEPSEPAVIDFPDCHEYVLVEATEKLDDAEVITIDIDEDRVNSLQTLGEWMNGPRTCRSTLEKNLRRQQNWKNVRLEFAWATLHDSCTDSRASRRHYIEPLHHTFDVKFYTTEPLGVQQMEYQLEKNQYQVDDDEDSEVRGWLTVDGNSVPFIDPSRGIVPLFEQAEEGEDQDGRAFLTLGKRLFVKDGSGLPIACDDEEQFEYLAE